MLKRLILPALMVLLLCPPRAVAANTEDSGRMAYLAATSYGEQWLNEKAMGKFLADRGVKEDRRFNDNVMRHFMRLPHPDYMFPADDRGGSYRLQFGKTWIRFPTAPQTLAETCAVLTCDLRHCQKGQADRYLFLLLG